MAKASAGSVAAGPVPLGVSARASAGGEDIRIEPAPGTIAVTGYAPTITAEALVNVARLRPDWQASSEAILSDARAVIDHYLKLGDTLVSGSASSAGPRFSNTRPALQDLVQLVQDDRATASLMVGVLQEQLRLTEPSPATIEQIGRACRTLARSAARLLAVVALCGFEAVLHAEAEHHIIGLDAALVSLAHAVFGLLQ